jgi:hypothetical protein
VATIGAPRLGELVVRDDHLDLVEGEDLRGAPVDLDHHPRVLRVVVELDPISDLEGALDLDREAGEQIPEGVLQ